MKFTIVATLFASVAAFAPQSSRPFGLLGKFTFVYKESSELNKSTCSLTFYAFRFYLKRILFENGR